MTGQYCSAETNREQSIASLLTLIQYADICPERLLRKWIEKFEQRPSRIHRQTFSYWFLTATIHSQQNELCEYLMLSFIHFAYSFYTRHPAKCPSWMIEHCTDVQRTFILTLLFPSPPIYFPFCSGFTAVYLSRSRCLWKNPQGFYFHMKLVYHSYIGVLFTSEVWLLSLLCKKNRHRWISRFKPL